MSALAFSEVLGRRIRSSVRIDQKVSTSREVGHSIYESRREESSALANYFVDEARVCWNLYRQWTVQLEDFLVERGMRDDELVSLRASLARVTRMPDGTLFELDKEWVSFHEQIANVAEVCALHDSASAHDLMNLAKETSHQTQDRDVKAICGYSSELSTELGENAILEIWQMILRPWFEDRHRRLAVDSFEWSESLDVLTTVTFEATRGHLVRPERTGDVELEESNDRFVIRFDPCGSGGRTMQGDEIEGTGPHMEAPYDWEVSEERHDWNHACHGACRCCAQCIEFTEQIPADHFGYPVRAVGPLIYRAGHPKRQQCRGAMYKDPKAALTEFCTRAGRTKPTEFGSAAHPGQGNGLAAIELAVLSDVVSTPYSALRLARVQPGQVVAVIGTSGMGSYAVLLGALRSARTIAVGPSAARLAVARSLGNEATIASAEGADAIRAVARGRIDVVIQCDGSPERDELAFETARIGATVMFAGVSASPDATSSAALIRRKLRLYGSWGFIRHDIADLIALRFAGPLRLEHLLTDVRPFDHSAYAFESVGPRERLRTTIEPWKGHDQVEAQVSGAVA